VCGKIVYYLPAPSRSSAVSDERVKFSPRGLGILRSRVKDTKGAEGIGREQVCGKLNSQRLAFRIKKTIAAGSRPRKTEEQIDNINDISVSVYVSSDLINRLALALVKFFI